jgi:RNase P subunit RPR2
MFELGAKFSKLARLLREMCPACEKPMTPSEPKPVLFSNGVREVTYTCESCGATIIRAIKDNDQD